MYRDSTRFELLFYITIAAGLLVMYSYSRLEPGLDPVVQLQEQHARGEIDQQTFERELEFVLDDHNEEIRAVEDVNSVGDVTS